MFLEDRMLIMMMLHGYGIRMVMNYFMMMTNSGDSILLHIQELIILK
jgi:hypothetical protein